MARLENTVSIGLKAASIARFPRPARDLGPACQRAACYLGAIYCASNGRCIGITVRNFSEQTGAHEAAHLIAINCFASASPAAWPGMARHHAGLFRAARAAVATTTR